MPMKFDYDLSKQELVKEEDKLLRAKENEKQIQILKKKRKKLEKEKV